MNMTCPGEGMGMADNPGDRVTQSLSLLLLPAPAGRRHEHSCCHPLSSATLVCSLALLWKALPPKDLSQQISAAKASAGRERRCYFRSYNALNFKQNIQCCGRDINLHASGHKNLPVTGD